MSDSDGSPLREDRQYRRSRSRCPVSPEWAGETPAEREERRLAEAAVPVGPPAGQPRAASADTGPSPQGAWAGRENRPRRPSSKPCRPALGGGPRRTGG